MKKKLTSVVFNGTKEQENALRAMIAKYKNTKEEKNDFKVLSLFIILIWKIKISSFNKD